MLNKMSKSKSETYGGSSSPSVPDAMSPMTHTVVCAFIRMAVICSVGAQSARVQATWQKKWTSVDKEEGEGRKKGVELEKECI